MVVIHNLKPFKQNSYYGKKKWDTKIIMILLVMHEYR